MWPQLVLAASNLFGVFALVKPDASAVSAFLVLLVMTMSTGMHLSENKHGLVPLIAHSGYWLNADRLAAVLAVLYFAHRLNAKIKAGETTDDQFVAMFIAGFLGFMCMTVGELLVADQTLYTLLHLIWHVVAYSIMRELA